VHWPCSQVAAKLCMWTQVNDVLPILRSCGKKILHCRTRTQVARVSATVCHEWACKGAMALWTKGI
jgi:hypothetical protein